MAGGVAMVIILVVVLPVLVLLGCSVLAAILGSLLWKDGEERNEGSELIELNR